MRTHVISVNSYARRQILRAAPSFQLPALEPYLLMEPRVIGRGIFIIIHINKIKSLKQRAEITCEGLISLVFRRHSMAADLLQQPLEGPREENTRALGAA